MQERLKVTHCLRQKGPSEALRKATQGPVGFAGCNETEGILLRKNILNIIDGVCPGKNIKYMICIEIVLWMVLLGLPLDSDACSMAFYLFESRTTGNELSPRNKWHMFRDIDFDL